MPHSFNVVWCYFFKVFAFSFYDVCNACQITVFFNSENIDRISIAEVHLFAINLPRSFISLLAIPVKLNGSVFK